jgi:hypothetical protein
VFESCAHILGMTQLSKLSRRSALALGAGAFILPHMATAAAKRPVLVELFTSQGCSSCPPADKLAGQLADDPNIVVVSFNVDYWDYLGWRDTLAKPEYTQRQYDYAKQRGDGSVYTPQMVVGGREHAVGSNRGAVNALLSSTGTPTIDIDLTVTKKEIKVSIPAHAATADAMLWLMAVEPQVLQEIKRGENAGSDIVYHNVVRNLVPAAMLKGEAYSGAWMRDTVMPSNCKSCIAVLQQGKVGPVLGLARV